MGLQEWKLPKQERYPETARSNYEAPVQQEQKKQGDIMLKAQNTLHYGDKPGEEIEIDL